MEVKHLDETTKQLARKLVVKLITSEEVETVTRAHDMMVEAIDMAIEFELLLDRRMIPAKEEE